jgi:NAD(P)-dependent dehydrogenase (short-subunit alcohol dehydrogenase family)
MSRSTKVAVITGGSSGIGLAVARELCAVDTSVVVVARNEALGQAAVDDLPLGMAEFVRADVSCEPDVAALFDRVRDRYGRLDFIFNGAGAEGAGVAPPDGWSDQHCDEVLSVNIKGVFLTIKHGVPLMLDSGGAIVNAASFVGTIVPILDAAIYGASKAAVISMTRAVAAGYADRGMRCYAVAPWVTDTPMIDRLTHGAGAEAKAGFAATFNPSGKLVAPREVSAIVCDMFLRPSAYSNGDIVLVDSGGTQKRIAPYAIEEVFPA